LGTNAIDPVCGMDVEAANALHRFEYAGNTYFFCGANCRASFSADPEHFLVQLGNT
jgi:Cu+-exporting ATPase